MSQRIQYRTGVMTRSITLDSATLNLRAYKVMTITLICNGIL